MKQFTKLGIALLAGSLWGAAEARAQILIDSFIVPSGVLEATAGNPQTTSTPVTIGTSSASRRLSVAATDSAGGRSSINDVGNWTSNASGSGSAEITLNYSSFDLSLGTNYFFTITVESVVASPMPLLDVSIKNSSAGITLTGDTALTNTVTGYSVFFDVRTLSGYSPAFLNGVDEVELVISGPAFFSVTTTSLQFLPVPEPSAALLVTAALGALMLRRRLLYQGNRLT
jgi:hypothetical protein